MLGLSDAGIGARKSPRLGGLGGSGGAPAPEACALGILTYVLGIPKTPLMRRTRCSK